jgi:hypothetical protein
VGDLRCGAQLVSGIQMALLGAFRFPPVTNTYTSGTAATETVPTGASSCTITVDGAGGSGAFDDLTFQPGGGGGSARSVKAIAVTGGNTFTYTVAPQVAGSTFTSTGTNGAASTVTGSPSGGSVNMSGGGGGGGHFSAGGGGGTATGGDTNTSGSAGTVPTGGVAASGAAASVAPGGGGDGAVSGTSGVGARGQVVFAYT